jgi:NDP-sugar pyrophosphorylase family protein
VTGFILAAGFGTRLKPLTGFIPKALVSACGRPLLRRAIDFFRGNGVDRIVINTHHHADLVAAFLASQNVSCALSHETPSIRGTGGAISFAKEFLSGDDMFCVANVDIVAAIDFAALRDAFVRLRCAAGLVAIRSKSGSVLYNRDTMDYSGAASEAGPAGTQKSRSDDSGDFLGIAFYKREALAAFNDSDFSVLPVWKRLQKEGMQVKILESPPVYWKDLGTPASLAAIHFDTLDGICPLDVPPEFTLNTTGKNLYPNAFTAEQAACLGPYSWMESDAVPVSSRLDHAVVFKNATVPENALLHNVLVTPYGVLTFDR